MIFLRKRDEKAIAQAKREEEQERRICELEKDVKILSARLTRLETIEEQRE